MSHLYDTGKLELIPAKDDYIEEDYVFDSYVCKLLDKDRIKVKASNGQVYILSYIPKVGWYGDYKSLDKREYEAAFWKRDGLSVNSDNLPF